MMPGVLPPLFENPKQILLDLARERSLPKLLDLIVTRFAASPRVALARVWLVRPGAGCETCVFASECPDRTECLHLVASAGSVQGDPTQRLERVDGRFRRFPIGVRKVGRIAATGEPIEIPAGIATSEWIVDRAWADREGIEGFAGQPLVHHGKVLGVLAVFSRGPLELTCIDWLRMIADHAAAALATARAFEQIEQLRARLESENSYLQEEVAQQHALGDLRGRSPSLDALGRKIQLVAPTDSAVLILGESGTGKELVARAIHAQSRRADRPLIKVNCAAVPRDLFESEFFGHMKGAFTGALRDRTGRFELADGGTLFLDEVGEIPLDLQAKLLRVLQEGELERVGDERTRKVDVRILAATHRNLRADVEAGRFRADLYYRLSVFPIEVPALRERRDDIPVLAEQFVRTAAQRLGRKPPRLTRATVEQLQAYAWPGNVRELQHVVERAVLTTPGSALQVELPRADAAAISRPAQAATPSAIRTARELQQLEVDNLRAALAATKGRIYGKDGAAELLGMRPTTLASRLKALGIAARDPGWRR